MLYLGCEQQQQRWRSFSGASHRTLVSVRAATDLQLKPTVVNMILLYLKLFFLYTQRVRYVVCRCCCCHHVFVWDVVFYVACAVKCSFRLRFPVFFIF